MLCAAERVWRRMARAPPVASSTAAYALGVRDVTCKLAALRSPDGWPPVHEQHWRGRTTKVRMSGRIAQTIVARHPLPLPESERFTRHPSPLATPLRREGASSTEGGASEARGKGAQTELPGQGRGAAGSPGGRMGARGGVAGSPGGRMGARGGDGRVGRERATGAGEAPGQRSRAEAAQAAVARHPPPRDNASQEKRAARRPASTEDKAAGTARAERASRLPQRRG